MAYLNLNGKIRNKDTSGGTRFSDECQPNGQPWATLEDAHNASPYRHLGDRRYILSDNDLGYDTYEYKGNTNSQNTDINKLSLVYKDEKPIQNLLVQQIKVEDFREKGDSDIRIWEKARDRHQQLFNETGISTPITAGKNPNRPDGKYLWTRTLIFSNQQDANIYAPEANILVQIPRFGFIEPDIRGANTPVDTTFPNETYLGPMRGAAIYIVRGGGEKINIGRIQGARMGIACLSDSNNPTFTFSVDQVNIGVFCYQGAQKYTLQDCAGTCSGAWFIGASTCFPDGSPYSGGDNCYNDGFTWTNSSTPKTASAVLNNNLDKWFMDSILRPNVPSYNATSNGTTYYQDNTLSDYCNPSGWLIFNAFRNGRNSFSPTINGVDARGGLDRGIALFNTVVQGLVWTGELALEGIGNQSAAAGKGYLTVGTVGSARIDIQFDAFDVGVFGNYRNKVAYTGRGYLTEAADIGGKGVKFTGGMITGTTWLDYQINGSQYYTTGILQGGSNGGVIFRSLDKNLVTYMKAFKGARLIVEGFNGQYFDCSPNSVGFSEVDLRDRTFIIGRISTNDGTIGDNVAVSGRVAAFIWDYGVGDPKALEAMWIKGLIQ